MRASNERSSGTARRTARAAASSGLAKGEVDKMVKDAEKFAQEDLQRKADIESRNKADNAHYQVQKFMQDSGDKLADADKQSLQREMDAVKAALDRNAGADDLEKATNQLMEEWQKVGAKMHQQAGPQTPPAEGGAGGAEGSGALLQIFERDRRAAGCLLPLAST